MFWSCRIANDAIQISVRRLRPQHDDDHRLHRRAEPSGFESAKALLRAADRFGVADRAMLIAKGPCVVRLPRTLRLALEQEAANEGVSFQQLLLGKLALPLAARSASGN